MALRDIVAALLGVSTYEKPSKQNALSAYGLDINDATVEEIREALGGQLQSQPTTRLRWYLKDLELAQGSADSGMLSSAAQLHRAMRRDGVIGGLVRARCAGLTRLPTKFYGDETIAGELRSRTGSRSVFEEMFPPSELALLDWDGIDLGVGVAELVPVDGRDYPVMVRLDPEYLQYRWNENRWYFQSIAGALPITPGDGRWVLHVPGGRLSPWNSGIWPALGRAFINKEHALLHRSNYSAKLANAARAATAPAGATEGQRLGWLQRVMAWGTNTVFDMPVGWDVKLIESNGRGYEVFQSEISTSDNEIMVALCGQIVTTTGGKGFGNADVPENILEDLVQSDGEALAFTINTQGLPQYIAARFGEQAINTRSTIVEWNTSKPKDLVKEAASLAAAGQAITALDAALGPHGLEVKADEIAERFNVPTLARPITQGQLPSATQDAKLTAVARAA